jgi:glucose-1-phosphate adenylyltransferase
MGSDFYEGEQQLGSDARQTCSLPPLGVGRNCRLERCIVDKNVRIGDGVVIKPQPDVTEYTGERRWIRDGITIIPKGVVIEPGTEL